jgi:hypothetical protein
VTVAGRVAAAAKAAALLDDEARAFHLFEAAAQQGDAAGMAGLAECFLYGRGGVRRNVDVAVAWFAIAAAKKCPRAIVECEALTMAYGAGTVRRSRPTQRVLLATIGRGSKLYAIAKRCYEEGRGGEGRDSDGLRLRWARQSRTDPEQQRRRPEEEVAPPVAALVAAPAPARRRRHLPRWRVRHRWPLGAPPPYHT